MKSLPTIFKVTGYLEAVSFLLLLLVAVPLKYAAGNPLWVKIIGPVHGLLFVGYIVAAAEMQSSRKWNSRTLMLAIVLALLPFGPFYFHSQIEKPDVTETEHQV